MDGEWLDPDSFLAEHPNWRDFSTLPKSSREEAVRNSSAKQQEDPLAKPGIIGAFCKTYTIEDTIEKFLKDAYAPSVVEGRYDYIKGEGTAGVVVYDGKFAYSHHATDPACGKLCNAFDLVRIHKFGCGEDSLNKMIEFASNDENVKSTMEEEALEDAYADFKSENSLKEDVGKEIEWDEPLPFDDCVLPPFPIDALPKALKDYALAVSEATQTPVDMAAGAILPILSVCMQGKYIINGKPDWYEPLNLFENIIAEPSERKSAVLNAVLKPITKYESNYNINNANQVEISKMQKRVLEKRQKYIEDQFVKGKADKDEFDKIATEIAEYKEYKPLRLYVDDITTEKLNSSMADNFGKSAIISSEGGIFDMLAGIYTKTVNIDVMLKAYSGDPIRVDRVGRVSENILHPALTMLLMVQPNVLSGLMQNKTFRGRGLTARFLYCLPTSKVGSRKYRTEPIPKNVYNDYESLIYNILEDEQLSEPHIITLSPEADALLEGFVLELEPKIKTEYASISDWIGKLSGTILRISGLLCRSNYYLKHELLEVVPLIVNKETMANAITLGNYFAGHAKAAFSLMGADGIVKQCKYVLSAIKEKELREFTKREIMRICRSFKTADELAPIIERLCDYGYISTIDTAYSGKGRPSQKYLVNPIVLG